MCLARVRWFGPPDDQPYADSLEAAMEALMHGLSEGLLQLLRLCTSQGKPNVREARRPVDLEVVRAIIQPFILSKSRGPLANDSRPGIRKLAPVCQTASFFAYRQWPLLFGFHFVIGFYGTSKWTFHDIGR